MSVQKDDLFLGVWGFMLSGRSHVSAKERHLRRGGPMHPPQHRAIVGADPCVRPGNAGLEKISGCDQRRTGFMWL